MTNRFKHREKMYFELTQKALGLETVFTNKIEIPTRKEQMMDKSGAFMQSLKLKVWYFGSINKST